VGAPVVALMNDGERQIGCGYTLLADRCVDERRLLGGGMSVVDDELMDDHERSSVCARHQKKNHRASRAPPQNGMFALVHSSG